MKDLKTFEFTLQTSEGSEYKYTGTLESLYKHLKSNEGSKVIDEKTRFA